VKTVIVPLSKNGGMQFCGLATALAGYAELMKTNIGHIGMPVNKS